MNDVVVMGSGEMLWGLRAIPWLSVVVRRYADDLRRLGIRDAAVESYVSAVIAAADRARTADTGSSVLPNVPSGSSSKALIDPVTTTEAARMLDCLPRNVVDLCHRRSFSTARQIGRRWQIERAEVLKRMERKAG